MGMGKTLLVLFTMVSAVLPAVVAENKEASEALSRAVAFHREAKDMAVRFRAEVYNTTLDKRDIYQGKLLLKGSSKFRLEIPGGTYVCDGATFWEHHSQTGQVLIRKASDMEDKPLPGEVLLRFLDSAPMSLAKSDSAGKKWLDLRLDPSKAMKNLETLHVRLNGADYSVSRISSRDLSGNESEYDMLSVKRNRGIKDKEFSFSIPKGAEVVDMR